MNAIRPLCVAACAVQMLFGAPAVSASDHQDGPKIADRTATPAGALDLNDLFVFVSPTNRANTVLILTASPAAGVVGPKEFFAGAAYELRISNDGAPFTEEIYLRVEFQAADDDGVQNYTVWYFDGGDEGMERIASGRTNGRKFPLRGGGFIQAGLFDDPAFEDGNALDHFNREATFLAKNRAGGTALPADITPSTDPARHFQSPRLPNSAYAGLNALGIVLEVPRLRLQSSRTNPNLTIWARTVADIGDGRGLAAYDRLGRPLINELLVPLSRTNKGETFNDGMQDQFNHLTPLDDVGLRTTAAVRLKNVFGLAEATATSLAAFFLPDVLPFNTTSTLGYPNGRRLTDDVTDLTLSLLTGGAVASDRVVSDSLFRRVFPYLGPPNPVTRVTGP